MTMRESIVLLVVSGALWGCAAEPLTVKKPSPYFLSDVPDTPAEIRESTICRALGGAGFRVDDVPGGALVSIHPTALATLRNVRLGADLLGRAFGTEHVFVASSGSEDACEIGELRRYAHTALVEQTNAGARVRLLSEGADDTSALRRAARQVVDELD